jgi:hypothetical protein
MNLGSMQLGGGGGVCSILNYTSGLLSTPGLLNIVKVEIWDKPDTGQRPR